MGRRVYEQKTGDFVWKYLFAKQGSEQSRITEELGIGTIAYANDYDVLTLTQEDRRKLEGWLQKGWLQNREPDIFWSMVKAYVEFMKQHKNQKVFYFEGEY